MRTRRGRNQGRRHGGRGICLLYLTVKSVFSKATLRLSDWKGGWPGLRHGFLPEMGRQAVPGGVIRIGLAAPVVLPTSSRAGPILKALWFGDPLASSCVPRDLSIPLLPPQSKLLCTVLTAASCSDSLSFSLCLPLHRSLTASEGRAFPFLSGSGVSASWSPVPCGWA